MFFKTMSSICRQILRNKNFAHFSKIVSSRTYASAASSTNESDSYDLVVVGGGIVGIASAKEFLKKHQNLRMAIVEKESELAKHQSGHNSGVIHAGIYYKPGSLKAKLCVQGLKLTYAYLDEKKIPYKKVGKLIVATSKTEVKRLLELHERGIQNKVEDLRLIDGKEIPEIEPYCRGMKALHSPHTGIVDFKLVANYYAKDFTDQGGKIYLNFEVKAFKEADDATYPVVLVATNGKTIKAKYVLTCGGLYSDKLAEYSGCSREPRIVPFRGEYLQLKPEKCHMIKGNIYPVPDPRFPFLGVHFTPRMDGSIWLGPNAVLAFRREGYTWFDIHLGELADAIKYKGFRIMASKYVMAGINETFRSFFSFFQVRQLQRFVPTITVADVIRGPAGVRAQALDNDGQLVDDFYFDMGDNKLGKRILHCRNAPSPGATSSLAIAKMMTAKLEEEFKL